MEYDYEKILHVKDSELIRKESKFQRTVSGFHGNNAEDLYTFYTKHNTKLFSLKVDSYLKKRDLVFPAYYYVLSDGITIEELQRLYDKINHRHIPFKRRDSNKVSYQAYIFYALVKGQLEEEVFEVKDKYDTVLAFRLYEILKSCPKVFEILLGPTDAYNLCKSINEDCFDKFLYVIKLSNIPDMREEILGTLHSLGLFPQQESPYEYFKNSINWILPYWKSLADKKYKVKNDETDKYAILPDNELIRKYNCIVRYRYRGELIRKIIGRMSEAGFFIHIHNGQETLAYGTFEKKKTYKSSELSQVIQDCPKHDLIDILELPFKEENWLSQIKTTILPLFPFYNQTYGINLTVNNTDKEVMKTFFKELENGNVNITSDEQLFLPVFRSVKNSYEKDKKFPILKYLIRYSDNEEYYPLLKATGIWYQKIFASNLR